MFGKSIRYIAALLILIGLFQPLTTVWAYPEVSGDEHKPDNTSYYQNYSSRNQPSEIIETPAPEAVKPELEPEPEPAPPMALVYIVNPGDTLFKIAKDFGMSIPSLQAYNDIANPNTLQVGQKLNIPSIPVDVPKMDGKEPVIQKVLSSTLTAYTSGVESTGKSPSHPAYGITFSGVKAEEGRTVAVDPSIIPLGSTVYIEGIGIRKAEDTGSAIKGAKIDVYMDDLGQAQTFGVKRNVKVFVLTAV